MTKERPERGDRYLHFKGRSYEAVGIGTETETGQQVVIYSPVNEAGNVEKETLFVRPLEMFMENIKNEGKETPRFKFIPQR